MKQISFQTIFVSIVFLVLGNVFCFGETKSPIQDLHNTTDWNLEPSFKFDTLCFLNALTGDSYYLDYYKDEFAKFENQLTPSAKTALANLKRKIKDENKGIISAFLTLYFSATDDEDLDEMLKTLKDSRKLQANLKQTQFYNEGSWKLFESVKSDLKTVFEFLKKIKFEKYWRENILPKIQQRIAKIQEQLPKFNIIPEIESVLGFALPSNKITVFMLFYSQPHGIRITGMRFLTDVAWSFVIVLRNAVHEMMHPPFDLKKDMELIETLNHLHKDGFLMDKILNHNPAFGYNSFLGFIEEDTVQALEQIINEKLKIEREARLRWKENDDGMHVFAVALYSLMKQENFPQNKESIRDFIVRIIKTGKLSAGKIKPLHESFYK